ncbi:MAG: energy transducer TonB [Kofleriaceae bacterium]|nr:energy transducer TonB [Kofleriaceae bacterium]
MRAQVLGSIAAHVALGALLLLVRRDGAPASAGEGAHRIEIVEVPPPQRPPTPPVASGSGGGQPVDASYAAPIRLAAANPARPSSTTSRRSTRSRAIADVDPRGAIHFDAAYTRNSHGDDGAGVGGDGGEGAGMGSGRGQGLGAGFGGALPPPPPPPPPALGEPTASKARPAQLVYPKRSRRTVEGETFIARVTIDSEGYVVGARLVRGFGGPRDAEAAGLIFKFRYAPALDDVGHPIRSTLDQDFLVE